ncbi:MAG: hypothetical protein A3B30_02010 [Candidatus Komeilibacteria bacterium RIFCSPLOWO2_01_FULL_52_15]|uniref:Uncharacterized protein n=2 Tax=Candidatus Komeiliibacteriota TaxID=1817908 RepID=A0A1G2BSF7_9BACT|nr:MAG: hypothetical protein A2677_01260 [Candidatus Komeilibacteria bacterium RIFCSPHIGHO2_01_FULL_52_14]OGY92094.1 MAG: hypothetical protein A3B30_02010 [Candidatus Komeilibacteria bacterium RIFCSPLOWO2_01_FULL_52_15]
MKKIINYGFLVLWAAPFAAYSQVDPLESLGEVGTQVYGKSQPTPIKESIGRLVQILLGLLGTFFIVLIIWGGAEWMFSGGNEKKIDSAKKRLSNAAIGLTIVFIAYSLAYAITNWLATATG